MLRFGRVIPMADAANIWMSDCLVVIMKRNKELYTLSGEKWKPFAPNPPIECLSGITCNDDLIIGWNSEGLFVLNRKGMYSCPIKKAVSKNKSLIAVTGDDRLLFWNKFDPSTDPLVIYEGAVKDVDCYQDDYWFIDDLGRLNNKDGTFFYKDSRVFTSVSVSMDYAAAIDVDGNCLLIRNSDATIIGKDMKSVHAFPKHLIMVSKRDEVYGYGDNTYGQIFDLDIEKTICPMKLYIPVKPRVITGDSRTTVILYDPCDSFDIDAIPHK